ncbi:MAG: sigma-E factor negative regulatory protein RseB [Oleiphilaceae bacterium]|jgi:sigma-E factor negative regulatory protein RseB
MQLEFKGFGDKMKLLSYNVKHTTENNLFLMVLMFLGLLLLSSIVSAVTAGKNTLTDFTPAQWLEKMQRASMEENYKGRFMFSRGEISSSMSIVHRYKDGEEHELLKQLDGEMGEIVRQGNQVMCVFPDNRVVQLEKAKYSNKIVQSFSNFIPDHTNYRLQAIGECRLVERPCIELAIKAVDKHRYSYSLWLDMETGLLLKSALKNDKGEDLERFQYTSITFPDKISDQDLEPMNAGSLVDHVMIPAVKKDVSWPSETKWKSEWVPPGFLLVNGNEQSGGNVLIFSDGLANYSIFIEKIEDNMMPEGASQVGATVAYSQTLIFKSHQYGVTVIGEIPAMTAMLIAESVKPQM